MQIRVDDPTGPETITPSADDQADLKYDNILVSPRGIAELHGRKIIIFVPAAEVNRMTLRFGRSAHRPVLTMAIGIVFALVGLFGVVEFLVATRGYRYELGMVALGLIGGSMIFDILKERFFFEVHGPKEIRRLVLSKNAQKKELEEFCDKVRSIYKYDVTEAAQDP